MNIIKKYNTFRFGILIISTALLLSCESKINKEEELRSLLASDKEFSELSKQMGAAEAFFEYADEEAIMFSKNSNQIEGRLKIKEAMQGLENYVLTWMPVDGTVSDCGDLGYTWGNFNLSFEDSEGENQLRIGKYVSVWKKQNKGDWKWIVDIGITDDEE